MKTTLFIIITVLAALLVEPAYGDVESVRLMPADIGHSPCVVKVALTNEAMHFSFSFRSQNETNAVYYAALRIYDGDHLVALCPVAQSRDSDFIHCEFTVGVRYLKDSRFYFTENWRIRGAESTSPTQYWFYLRDFGDAN